MEIKNNSAKNETSSSDSKSLLMEGMKSLMEKLSK
jgi:hypothetical protein